MSEFSNLVFDLDGTLVDSLPGIEASIRYAVNHCFPGRAIPAIREQIGPPIAKMFRNLWPELDSSEHDKVIAAFREHYDAEGCRLSRLYPQVHETLAALKADDVAMFVVTNKPLHATSIILDETRIDQYFRDVISPDKISPPYGNKADAVRALRDKYRLDPRVTAVVGDGSDDHLAAKSCGFAFILASYGYGKAALDGAADSFAVLESFGQLLSLRRAPD